MKKFNSKDSLSKLAKGSLVLGAIAGFTGGEGVTNAFAYSSMGNGSEVREALASLNSSAKRPAELKCAADAKSKTEKKTEGKAAEHKCGEGKADAKATKTKAEKADAKTAEHKCGEGKCGEGKCGEGKADAKAAESKAEKSDEKTAEHKCGEGKCGN